MGGWWGEEDFFNLWKLLLLRSFWLDSGLLSKFPGTIQDTVEVYRDSKAYCHGFSLSSNYINPYIFYCNSLFSGPRRAYLRWAAVLCLDCLLNSCMSKYTMTDAIYCWKFLFWLKKICFCFLQVLFNNEDMDGQMVLSLDTEPIRLTCEGDVDYKSE